MANSNGSFGLRPLSKLGGGANSTGLTGYTPYEIASDNSDKIYHGQLVIPLASGYIDHTANAAGGTVSHLGVFQGCEYVSSVTGKTTWSNSESSKNNKIWTPKLTLMTKATFSTLQAIHHWTDRS